MVVQRVEVRWVRRPFVFTNEFTAVGSNQSWASFAVCGGAPSCRKMKPDGKTDLQSWTSFGNRVSGLEWNATFPSHWNRHSQKPWHKWKLQVAVDYSVHNGKYGISYLYSHNFGENLNIFLNFRIVAGSRRYKLRNLGIKISHSGREIAFCLVGYFNLSHPVDNNNNNNNNHDNVYGAVIMAEPLREFTRFIWWM